MGNKFKKQNQNIAVFTDFDGTITKLDIGDEIFKVFGEFEPHHSLLMEGTLGISEYWNIVCNSLRVGKKEIEEFALKAETDMYFAKFAEYCKSNEIDIKVISDGFDAYIYPVLIQLGLDWVKVRCNSMKFLNGKIEPVFPLASESCECLCASCKRNAMLNEVPEKTIIVFIGDGVSDYCAAEHADIIFAKGKLAAYCNANKLPHYPYNTFFDVIRIFEKIFPDKLKQRNQADLLRRKAFETE